LQGSLKRIEWLNKHRNNSNSALYGITEFSDLTPYEFQQFILRRQDGNFNFHKYNKNSKLRRKRSFSDIPKHWDWRNKKVVTTVKDQKDCGACWAFSTVETMETMYALKTGILKELSVQQLIDCAKGSNQGCDGGDTCGALMWLNKYNVSVVTEAQYPLKNVAQPCKIKKPKKGIQITDEFSCDKTSSVPYYIVRNSWGSKFGVDGYLKIAVGKNLCGIAEEVSYLDIL
ncbi:cathepsin O-like, partial [Limulus polyphemus]|uniref:Cathepsin O-like n=1 Tax=Limulus polyphemus TaxID=6850 RepID=A0ABM1TDB3_LIMPO